MKKILLVLTLLFNFLSYSESKTIVEVNNDDYSINVSSSLYIKVDKENEFSFDDIKNSNNFVLTDEKIPNLGISRYSLWVKFHLKNNTSTENLLLSLPYPILDYVVLYQEIDGEYQIQKLGEYVPITEREYKHQNFIFDIHQKIGSVSTYYINIKSSEQVMLPLTVGTSKAIFLENAGIEIINGVYFGLVLVMIFYNLFIFFSVKDNNYIKYVGYIILIGLTQASDQGYTYRLIWPNYPEFAGFMVTTFPVLVGVAAMLFMRSFLNTKQHLPKSEIILFFLIGMYSTSIFFNLIGYPQEGYKLLQITAIIVSIFMFVVAFKIMKKGYKSAKFFLLAWSAFLISVCVFIMKDFGILPYNNFTKFSLHIGSGIEMILLSFALADKINIMKKEKEESQARTLEALKENQRIVKEQNIVLEHKVKERTGELEKSNLNLSKTLTDLKETQAQLLDSEKMASLGQLTAGVAHEINNPINFVTSNINPLKKDINDIVELIHLYDSLKNEEAENIPQKLKEIKEFEDDIEVEFLLEEINMLLKGMEEGATRTAEIVKSLRTFSRLDESNLKNSDINESLESTLLLLKSSFGDKIVINKNYSELEPIECYAGKLNQLFMNILNNGIQAVNEKKYSGDEQPTIALKTEKVDDYVLISIADNGIGMDENTKKKIYDPFFTTKDVGKGTGLGMSIVYNIIEKHEGMIDLISEPGKGTEFRIFIPRMHDKENEDTKKSEAYLQLKQKRKEKLREIVKKKTTT
ncbi:MAG: GHKL domain-containing protein [Chitinophagaceae bacterium]|nr:MAG: GHKL domain-containing protein [Chitinophagaceae bacterium]